MQTCRGFKNYGGVVDQITIARELWGWAPQYPLDQALDETIEWVRNHLDQFRVDSYTT